MDRRKFFKRLFIGSAVIAVSPKIIAEITKPKPEPVYPFFAGMSYDESRKYFIGVDVATGYVQVFGTADNHDRIDALTWAIRKDIIVAKSRRKGFGFEFAKYYEEAGMFPKLK